MNALLFGKLVSQLVLPPGGLILLAAVGLVFCRRRWGVVLIFLSLSGLWLLSVEPVRDALLQPLEYRDDALQADALQMQGTVIVLLGGGLNVQAPAYGGADIPGRFAMMRTVYAARLALDSGLPVYATGGKVLSDTAEAEGDVLRRWLLHFGVPAEQAHAENAANNTWENADYIRAMLETQGVQRVVLVTSAWHMPRARWCFEQQGLYVIAAPTDYLSGQEDYGLRSYLPDAGVLAASSLALHEHLGLWWYRFRYG